jgi:hypothetical protein
MDPKTFKYQNPTISNHSTCFHYIMQQEMNTRTDKYYDTRPTVKTKKQKNSCNRLKNGQSFVQHTYTEISWLAIIVHMIQRWHSSNNFYTCGIQECPKITQDNSQKPGLKVLELSQQMAILCEKLQFYWQFYGFLNTGTNAESFILSTFFQILHIRHH